MDELRTCARCGEQKLLCHSCRMDGVQQPCLCKECILVSMQTGDYAINNVYWLRQLHEAEDIESLQILWDEVAK